MTITNLALQALKPGLAVYGYNSSYKVLVVEDEMVFIPLHEILFKLDSKQLNYYLRRCCYLNSITIHELLLSISNKLLGNNYFSYPIIRNADVAFNLAMSNIPEGTRTEKLSRWIRKTLLIT